MAAFTRKRAVITGLGVVAPNGIGKDVFWSTLINRQSGIAPITLFDASRHPCKIAGEVKNFDLGQFLDVTAIRSKRISRQTHLALAASALAIKDAGLNLRPPDFVEPLLISFGVSTCAIEVVTQSHDRMLELGPKRVPVHAAQAHQPYHSSTVVAGYLGCATRTQTIASACPAGLDAVSAACDRIRSGEVNIALAGGVDAPVNALAFACMAQGGMIAASDYAPEKASRPFDAGHTVGVISEGAGLLVLEDLDHARARGARIYAEVTGFATSMDDDFAQPGIGYIAAMRQALIHAGRHADEIDYVCAHGPGHAILDRQEAEAIHAVFGAHARQMAVSSVKGVTGNPLAAAGGFQLVACCLALERGLIPPTANCENPDPLCALDCVSEGPRQAHPRAILINSHGLGNSNSAMILEPPPS